MARFRPATCSTASASTPRTARDAWTISGRRSSVRSLPIWTGSSKNGTRRYRAIEAILGRAPGVRLPRRPEREAFVGSSIQFLVPRMHEPGIRQLVKVCLARGVELKWFGDPEPAAYTSRYDSWRYLDRQSLPVTDRVLASLLDMRIPLTFSVEDCRSIGEIVTDCLSGIRGGAEGVHTASAGDSARVRESSAPAGKPSAPAGNRNEPVRPERGSRVEDHVR